LKESCYIAVLTDVGFLLVAVAIYKYLFGRFRLGAITFPEGRTMTSVFF